MSDTYDNLGFSVTDAAIEVHRGLGPWARADLDQHLGTGYALLKFLDAVYGVPMQEVHDLIRDRDGHPGWSLILDHERVPDHYLDWLGQWVGALFDPDMPPAEKRDMLIEVPGWRRGTPEAIMAAVRRLLIGSKTVTLTERDTSPYHFDVRIYRADVTAEYYYTSSAQYATYTDRQAADPAYSDIPNVGTDRIRYEIDRVKPAGLQYTVSIFGGASYLELDQEFTTYTNMGGAAANYSALSGYIP